MTPTIPKPMFLAQIHPGLVGTLAFYFSKNRHLGPWALKGPPASTFGPLGPLRAHLVGPLRAHLVGPLGPLRAYTPPEPELEPEPEPELEPEPEPEPDEL